jgi:hypothetical protein
MFMRACGAQGRHEQPNGDVILSKHKGGRLIQYKVTAAMLSSVQQQLKNNVYPSRQELKPRLLKTSERKRRA